MICLTEICQSKDFINFLGFNSNNEQIKGTQSLVNFLILLEKKYFLKFFQSILKSVSESLFDRNSSKLDPIVNFANISPTLFEYSKEVIRDFC